MQQLEILTGALAFIEENLAESIKTEDVAAACYCSKASLEKIFRSLQDISVHDYITRRRMTLAGRELVKRPERRIIDIAMDFGYTSNEAFTRTFYQVWSCNPSEFRKSAKDRSLKPGDQGDLFLERKEAHKRKKIDISELYDYFAKRKNCYFVCCVIEKPYVDLRKTAVTKAIARMNEAASREDDVFRIGENKFIILTNSTEEAYAKSVADKVIAGNDEQLVLYAGVRR